MDQLGDTGKDLPHWRRLATEAVLHARGPSASHIRGVPRHTDRCCTGQESYPRTFGPIVSITNAETESHIRGVPRHARRRTLVTVAVEAVEAAGAEHEHGLVANGSDRRARVQGG